MEESYVVNVDCAVRREDAYLFIERAASEEHAAGQLAFPGGKVEDPPDGEDALAATARREVREETGVAVEDVAYVTSGTFVSDTGHDVLNVVVTGRFDGGEARAHEPAEVGAVHWLTAEAFRERDPPGFLREYVERVEVGHSA